MEYTPNDDHHYSYELSTREANQNRPQRSAGRERQNRRGNQTRLYITNDLDEINENDL